MVTVDEYGRVRIAFRDGMGLNELARTFHHSKRNGNPRPKRNRAARRSSSKTEPPLKHTFCVNWYTCSSTSGKEVKDGYRGRVWTRTHRLSRWHGPQRIGPDFSSLQTQDPRDSCGSRADQLSAAARGGVDPRSVQADHRRHAAGRRDGAPQAAAHREQDLSASARRTCVLRRQ